MGAETTTAEKRPDEAADAFSSFYEAEHERQVRGAFLLVGDAAVAHDVVAEAFVAVYQRWGNINDPGPYLQRCVMNGCKDVHRRGRRHELAAEPTLTVVDEGGPPSMAAAEMAALLLALPFRQRAALVLRYYGGHSEREIAAALGCRPGTVGSLISRGLKALRRDLEGEIS